MFMLTTLLCYRGLYAQLANTRWKTTLHIESKALNVILDFKNDTALLYTVADSILIEKMTYTKSNRLLTLLKVDGQSDCENDMPGEYGYTIKGDSLFLELLNDKCYDRYIVLQHTKWKRWIAYPGIKVDEKILKEYTGVYAHDTAHPITISLENGILYAEGPNNGLPKSAFTAITASRFLLRIAGVEMDFIRDAKGIVTSLVSHEEKDFVLKKIN